MLLILLLKEIERISFALNNLFWFLESGLGFARHPFCLFCRILLFPTDIFPAMFVYFSQTLHIVLFAHVFLSSICATIPQVSVCSFAVVCFCLAELQNAYTFSQIMLLVVLQCYRMLMHCQQLGRFSDLVSPFSARKY